MLASRRVTRVSLRAIPHCSRPITSTPLLLDSHVEKIVTCDAHPRKLPTTLPTEFAAIARMIAGQPEWRTQRLAKFLDEEKRQVRLLISCTCLLSRMM